VENVIVNEELYKEGGWRRKEKGRTAESSYPHRNSTE
jgi:hypothetical protein